MAFLGGGGGEGTIGALEGTGAGIELITSPGGWFLRGDTNADGLLDVSDAVAILLFLFTGGQEPSCLATADVDDSDTVTMADTMDLLMYLFKGGVPPEQPSGVCGPDPTPGVLTCESYAPCR